MSSNAPSKAALVQVHLPDEYGGGSLTLKAEEGATVGDIKEQAISRVTKKRLSVVEGPGQLRPQIFNMGRRCSNLGRSGNEFSVEDLADQTVIGTEHAPGGAPLQMELRKAESAAENGFQYCISNHQGRFLGCEGNAVRAGGIDDKNTTWTLLDGPDHCKLVRSPDGLYLTANKEGKVYLAPQGLWSQWEIQKGKRQFFRSHAHRTYLTQHADGHLFCGPKSQPGEFTICLALTRGYLKKKARGPKGLKQWQSRYFIFNGRVLSYWHKMEQSDGEPAGAYAVDQISNVHVDEKKPCRFNVELRTEAKKAVHLLAATPEECQMWVQQLRRKGVKPVRSKRLSVMPSAGPPFVPPTGIKPIDEDASTRGKPSASTKRQQQQQQPRRLSLSVQPGLSPRSVSRGRGSLSAASGVSTPTSQSSQPQQQQQQQQHQDKQKSVISLSEDLGTDYCVSNAEMLYLRADDGVYTMGPVLDDRTTFTFFNGPEGSKLLRDYSGRFMASDAAGNLFAATEPSEPAAQWTIVRGKRQFFKSIYGMFLTTHGSVGGPDKDNGAADGGEDGSEQAEGKSLHCSSKSEHAKFTICLVLVKGTLKRRDASTGGAWKQQYFIFNGKVLSYWDDVSLIDSELPTDSFELAKLKRSYTNPAHPTRFNVEFEGGQTMELLGEDEDSCRRWVKALTRKGVKTAKVDRRLSVAPGSRPAT